MGQYLPYAGTDSIQEAVIALHFLEGLGPDVLRTAQNAAQTGLKDTFSDPPQTIAVQEVRVTITGKEEGLSTSPQSFAGFEFVQAGTDSGPIQVLRLQREALSVHYRRYPGWSAFLSNSLRYVDLLLSSITFEQTPVHAFSLRYRDRYNFHTDGAGVPDAHTLFRDNSAYLSASSFRHGPWWHCHTGWFEPLGKTGRILHQIRVNSARVDEVPTATIDHSAQCRLRTPRQTVKSVFQKPTGDSLGVEAVLNTLHDRNKGILVDMLLPSMAQKIGLTT